MATSPPAGVIHTVGPAYSPVEDRSAALASCYRRSLEVADALGAVTVSFPAISTGGRRWPVKDAARIAIDTLRGSGTGVTEVRFVLASAEVYGSFRARLEPTDEEIAFALAAHPAERWRELLTWWCRSTGPTGCRSSPLYQEARGLDEAHVADAARLATTFVRRERFCDGTIQKALENGALPAILARLRRWFETEHPGR